MALRQGPRIHGVVSAMLSRDNCCSHLRQLKLHSFKTLLCYQLDCPSHAVFCLYGFNIPSAVSVRGKAWVFTDDFAILYRPDDDYLKHDADNIETNTPYKYDFYKVFSSLFLRLQQLL